MSLADVVLIMPPNNFSDMIKVEENHQSSYYVHYPHLGLLYLAACCERAGYKVQIIDALAERITASEVVARVARVSPKYVGITVTTPTLRICYQLCQALQQLPSAPEVILGGPHISSDPEVLKVFPCRLALRGEADETFPRLLRALENHEPLEKIPGLVLSANGDFFAHQISPVVKSIDSLPFPARHLIPNRLYSNPINALPTTSAITVRGCPFDCAFCSRAVRGRKTTAQSITHSLAELQEVQDRFGIRYVTFMDETFTLSKSYVYAFCEGLLKKNIKLKWGCQTRADLVDEEMLKLMKKAGCQLISCGVESGSERIRKLLHKPVPEEVYFRFVALCRKAGLETNTFWIFGHPTETLDDLKKTLAMCVQLGSTYASFNITNIFVGSPIYDQLLREGKIYRKIWDDYTLGRAELPIYVPRGMSEDFLRSQIALAFRKFYLRPGPVVRRMKRWRDLRELRHDIKIFSVLTTHYMRKKIAA